MNIPNKWRAGSKPLDIKDEFFANELISNAAGLAGMVYYDIPEVKQSLNKLNVDNKDEGIILVEITIFNIFLTSIWVIKNYKNKPRELLDRFYYIYEMVIMAENDHNKYDKFFNLVTSRYDHYDQSLKNNTGSGPGYWLPNTLLKYIVASDDLSKYDAGPCMTLTLNLGMLMKIVPESIEKILKEYEESQIH